MFWKQVFESTLRDWQLSCQRGDSLQKRTMYLRRLDAVIQNMTAETNRLSNQGGK
jgi:hypothetical protein